MSAGIGCRSAFLSHQGAVRSVNEDSFFEAPELGVWAVADGMGGHEAGQLASTMIIDALDTMPLTSSTQAMLQAVSDRLSAVNQRLRVIAAERYGGRIIGSTLAMLVIDQLTAICLWAGDSRVYLYRNQQLQRLTRDHSRIEELIASGQLELGDAKAHSLANVITRAVGAEERLNLETRSEPLVDGDRFLLCTDGLNKTVGDEELPQLLEIGDCAESASRLLQVALQRQPTDNVTLGVVQIGDVPLSDKTVPRRLGAM